MTRVFLLALAACSAEAFTALAVDGGSDATHDAAPHLDAGAPVDAQAEAYALCSELAGDGGVCVSGDGGCWEYACCSPHTILVPFYEGGTYSRVLPCPTLAVPDEARNGAAASYCGDPLSWCRP
jgi:hypothetical protein